MTDRYKARYVQIYEHMLELCGGDAEKCVLLDKLIFFSGQKEDQIKAMKEEVALGNITANTDLDSLSGWVRKSASELCKDILIGSTPRNVARKLRDLIDSGLLMEKPDLRQGQSSNVRPNASEIKKRLALLGYTLEGGIMAELVEGVKEQYANPSKATARMNQAEYFAAVPGPVVNTNPKVKAEKEKTVLDAQVWMKKQRRLDHTPDNIKYTAYLVYTHTGFMPDSALAISGLNALDKEAKGNQEYLIAGLKAGEKARQKGMTMKGPGSYQSYVRDAVAKANRPVDATVHVSKERGSDGESKPSNRAGEMHGQREVVKNGKLVLEIGSSRKVAA